jgi:large subunit ribosomal protein L2
MGIKYAKPVNSSTRQLIQVDFSELSKVKPNKVLTQGLSKNGGRNHHGRLTSFRKGGGHKRKYRLIDFKRTDLVKGSVNAISYDPNRSAFIAEIQSINNKFFYILAPNGLKIGDIVESGQDVPKRIGNTLPLKSIPVGTLIHNIELKPGAGGKYARAAGSFATLLQHVDENYALVRLKSGEQRLVPINCCASIGVVSNSDHQNVSLSKAGRSRWLGRRPVVRGVAMNPVDHPHGGGEGKTSGGRPSVSPWGKLTKGPRTRNPKKKNTLILQSRRKL